MTQAGSASSGERKLVWSPATQQFRPAVPTAGTKTVGFIKGPLPLDWMQRAARLPGKTLQVGLTLWYLAGLQKSQTVKLASKQLESMGVSRDAKYDALARLVASGLVTVNQKPGRAPIVTLQTSAA
jgi:hypothetical protein